MAGVFNIFSEIENAVSPSLNRGKENSRAHLPSKLKSSAGITGFSSAKNFTQSVNKPRGLSIRSNSDLNVSLPSNPGGINFNSKEFKKLLPEQCISKPSVSPMKLKTPKKNLLEKNITKKLSPKISSPIMQNVIDDFVFAKPVTPKKLVKCPEPEKLSYYYDQYKYMDEEIEQIFDNDRTWLRSARKRDSDVSIVSFEDEGFISGPEISFDAYIDSSSPSLSLSDVELPDISDLDIENDSFEIQTKDASPSTLDDFELSDTSDSENNSLNIQDTNASVSSSSSNEHLNSSDIDLDIENNSDQVDGVSLSSVLSSGTELSNTSDTESNCSDSDDEIKDRSTSSLNSISNDPLDFNCNE